MRHTHAFLCVALVAAMLAPNMAADSELQEQITGVLELDDFTFDKVVDGSSAVLLEVYSPWCKNCPHDELRMAARMMGDKSTGILAKANGEINPVIFKRLAVSNYPTFYFFPKGSTKHQLYTGPHTHQGFLKQFLTNVKDGVLEELEGLVQAFMAHETERDALLLKAEEAAKALEGDSAGFGAYYVKTMKNVLDSGREYLAKETKRLQKVIKAGGLKLSKEVEFRRRVNILQSFDVKDEL